MPENLSNLLFIAVALAIFIGRTVAQARKRREEAAEGAKKAPPPPSPRPAGLQALHFEEKDGDDSGYLRRTAAQPAAKTAKPSVKKQSAALTAKTAASVKKEAPVPANLDKLFPPVRSVAAVSSGQGDFSFNLDHLSPLKQAVIMAEVLGPPKGMTT